MVLSYDDIRDLVRAALAQGQSADTYTYVRALYPTSVVYEREPKNGAVQTYRRAYVLDDAGAVTLGAEEAVRPVTTYEPVAPATFTMEGAETSEEDGFVVHKGKVFECGDYPDKKFALTEDEADAALGDSGANNLEHVKSVLDGKLGATRLTHRVGKDVFGEVRIPKWLKKEVGPAPVKVSAEWSPATKRFLGLALCLKPRITDAQVVAAFTEATGEAPADPAESGGPRKEAPQMKPTFTERLAAVLPAFLTGKAKEEDVRKALFSEDDAEAAKPPETGVAPAPTEAEKAKDAEIARLKAEIAAKDEARGKAEAEGSEAKAEAAAAKFADALVAAGKAVPAEREGIARTFARIAALDSGKVAFSADGAASGSEALKEFADALEARPANALTTERLKGDGAVVFSGAAGGEGEAPDPARVRELLGKTPLGQKILREQKDAGNGKETR